ncbi:MAG: hypothetical protein M3327_00150 [Actinomycetota bacterium]|nr:hypothetical protein [Actinomycetota bacterium]
MNEFNEHGPVPDAALGDPAAADDEPPTAGQRAREAGTEPARGETDEHRESEAAPN